MIQTCHACAWFRHAFFAHAIYPVEVVVASTWDVVEQEIGDVLCEYVHVPRPYNDARDTTRNFARNFDYYT